MNHLVTNYRTEIRQFATIAMPLAVAYLAEYSMFITTKMIVGQLGYQQLAAAGITGDLSFEFLFLLMALLSIVGVLAAQAHGAGEVAEVGQTVRQGLIIATLFGVPAMAVVWNMDYLLAVTGQDEAIVNLATPFAHGLTGFVLPILWFAVLRNFVAALARPAAVLIITLAAVGMNYLLTIWLVHGGLGIDALGMLGAGLAISIVNWAMFLCLGLYIYFKPNLRGYGVFKGRWRIDKHLCAEILKLGTPVAGLTFMEISMFIAVSILSGSISAKTLAAYEITVAWAGIPFVIAIGLAEATMVRVAFAAGRRDIQQVRRAGWLGMTLGATLLTVLIVIPIGLADTIVNIFITPQDPGFTEVSNLATQFLMIAAIFQIFDGLQVIATRALRGIRDTTIPLWIAGFGYWVLGIGGGALFAFHYQYGGIGLWWGLALALSVTACLLCWRFYFTTSRKFETEVVST